MERSAMQNVTMLPSDGGTAWMKRNRPLGVAATLTENATRLETFLGIFLGT